jgi:hypothetical protein
MQWQEYALENGTKSSLLAALPDFHHLTAFSFVT